MSSIQINESVIISKFLLDNCQLWIWDFDDTIINTKAYLMHDMHDKTIEELSDVQFNIDVPFASYFRKLVEYIYNKGIKIGIASFGAYSVIQVYMNKIFGFNQKYFNSSNIKAFHRNINANNYNSKRRPINKNEYIYDLMKFFKISTFSNVVLFDDNASNIADADSIGIVSIQIDSLFQPNIMSIIDSKYYKNVNSTSHPKYYNIGSRKIWNKIPLIDDKPTMCSPDLTKYLPGFHKENCSEFNSNRENYSDSDTSSILYYLPNKSRNISLHGDLTKQKSIGIENFTDGNKTITITKCINMIIFIGLIIGLGLFIYQIHISHDIDVMIIWSIILFFVLITCIIYYNTMNLF